jgi:hypothetical protein
MGWMGRHVDADEAEWVCRGDSVEDEGRILSSISNKFVSPVNKEIVGASHLTTPGREAPQMPQHSSNLKRAPQHDCNDNLVSFSSHELILFVLHSKSHFYFQGCSPQFSGVSPSKSG